jgi:L-threonylcarbamoyladenylate synthase
VTDVEAGAAAVRNGEVVVMPTDTVYGVAALPSLEEAVRRLFRIKRRPQAKAVPILGAGIHSLRSVAQFDERAQELAQAFWPGPLTLVLRRSETFPFDLGGEDRDTVAVRVPESPVALDLLAATGPLAVTSANRSGRSPARTVSEAQAEFGSEVAVYVDGGRCGGQPSTVVSLVNEPTVLRPGPLPEQQLRRLAIK